MAEPILSHVSIAQDGGTVLMDALANASVGSMDIIMVWHGCTGHGWVGSMDVVMV